VLTPWRACPAPASPGDRFSVVRALALKAAPPGGAALPALDMPTGALALPAPAAAAAAGPAPGGDEPGALAAAAGAGAWQDLPEPTRPLSAAPTPEPPGSLQASPGPKLAAGAAAARARRAAEAAAEDGVAAPAAQADAGATEFSSHGPAALQRDLGSLKARLEALGSSQEQVTAATEAAPSEPAPGADEAPRPAAPGRQQAPQPERSQGHLLQLLCAAQKAAREEQVRGAACWLEGLWFGRLIGSLPSETLSAATSPPCPTPPPKNPSPIPPPGGARGRPHVPAVPRH
jgi:hypothetical protein